MALINKIVDAGYHVVRFDNRDTGLSTWISDFNAAPYSLEDMADDTIGLMDALNIEKAHIIVRSMGGVIAQIIAIHYPDRVLSLTSWMSTYWSKDPDISVMSDEMTSWFEKLMGGKLPEIKEEIIEENIQTFQMFCGSRFPLNEQWLKSKLEESYDRGWDLRTTQNHTAAMVASPSRLESLKTLISQRSLINDRLSVCLKD